MNYNSIPTVHHANLEELRTFNKEFSTEDHTTLNQLYGVSHGVVVPAAADGYNKYPIMEWLSLGVAALHENNIPRHRSTDGALFMGIPWIARVDTPGTDLQVGGPSPNRSEYSIRYAPSINTTIRGVTYQAGWVYYFLKRLDLDAVLPQKHTINVTNGIPGSPAAFNHSASDLTLPMPVDIDNDVLNQVEGTHVTVQTLINLELTTTDITEIINVCDHLFNDPSKAVITELGLVSGYNQGTLNAPVVTHAQHAYYIGTNIPLQGSLTDTNLTFAVGSSTPLPSTLSTYNPLGN